MSGALASASARAPVFRVGIATVVLVLASGAAQGERPVYRALDECGGVTYSDRPAATAATPLKNYQSPNPSPAGYHAARLRADTERVYYERLRAEDRLPVPIVTYDPRAQPVPSRPRLGPLPPHRLHGRWDPNLPDSPAPSLDRHYLYDGR